MAGHFSPSRVFLEGFLFIAFEEVSLFYISYNKFIFQSHVQPAKFKISERYFAMKRTNVIFALSVYEAWRIYIHNMQCAIKTEEVLHKTEEVVYRFLSPLQFKHLIGGLAHTGR